MKQALEALEYIENNYMSLPKVGIETITSLRQAIAQAEKRDTWTPNDTAYRPGGLPQDFIVHEVENEGDWSEWVCPNPTQYFMKCCDCGLVHEMQFKVVKYSEGDECDGVDDPDVQGIFRARRVESVGPYTTPQPQHEWVGLTQEDIDIAFDDTQEGGGFNEFARAIEQRLKEKNALKD